MHVDVQAATVRQLQLNFMLRHLIKSDKLNAWKVLPATFGADFYGLPRNTQHHYPGKRRPSHP